MEINGKTRLLGLMGNPVEHTLSPAIHNTLAEQMGLNVCYVPFLVESGKIRAAVEGAYALNVLGMNVTVPYKQAVMDALTGLDPLAEQIGAVNTLVREEGGYRGYNTDALGFLRELEQENIRVEGETAAVLGAGGASRAVVFSLVKEGIRKIYLLNRSFAKAQELSKEVNRCYEREAVVPLTMEDYKKIEEERILAVQCTSVGLAPESGRCVLTSEDFYRNVHTGVDLIYQPSETMFMKLVRQQGGKACNGLKMLLYQGVTAFELFVGQKVPEEMSQIAYERLCELLKPQGGM